MAKEKEWREGEPSKLVVIKVEAKAEIREEAIAKAVQFGMRFWQSVLLLIRQKHSSIDLSGINFASIEGNNIVDPNDESIVVLAGKVGDDEREDLDAPKDAKDALNVDQMATFSTTSLPHPKLTYPFIPL